MNPTDDGVEIFDVEAECDIVEDGGLGDDEESGGIDPGVGRNVVTKVVGIVGNNPAMSVLWVKQVQQVHHVVKKVNRLTYHNTKREDEPLPPPILVPIRSLILWGPEALTPPRPCPPIPVRRPSLRSIVRPPPPSQLVHVRIKVTRGRRRARVRIRRHRPPTEVVIRGFNAPEAMLYDIPREMRGPDVL